MNASPSYYGIPHEAWRPGQLEAVRWIVGNSGNLIVSAATGSGKTALAKALSIYGPTVALVKTKSLQVNNYGKGYGYDVLMGRGNYTCVAQEGKTCEDCLFGAQMNKCRFAKSCEYLTAKRIAMKSNAASVNYAYWLTTDTFKHRDNYAIVMDEAHLLPDITLEFSGVLVSEEQRQKYNLPEFPEIYFDDVQDEKEKEAREKAIAWLEESYQRLKVITDSGQLKMIFDGDEDEDDESRAVRKLNDSVGSVLYYLSETKQFWYIRAGKFSYYSDGAYVGAFEAKPLTARYHFPGLFLAAPTNLLMSATIGNAETFSKELGISSYQFREIPSQFTPSERPIIDLGAPKISYNSPEADYDKQATLIANAIKSVNREWCGIIHVTSKQEAFNLVKRLSKRGLANRVWVPASDFSTSKTLSVWNREKKRTRGAICVTWNMTEGVDLLEEKICISAKVPFKSLGSPFAAMRAKFSPDFYRLQAAWELVQSLGRTRRGRPEDYGAENGLVAIADGNWSMVKNYIDSDILAAIVRG